MSNAFSASAVDLATLLSGAHQFVTPDFQRPYSWGEREVGSLLEDLLLALDEYEERPERASVFFLGAIVLIGESNGAPSEREPAHSADRTYLIIDGQQRLVTLTILFAVLRELARAEGDSAHADDLHAKIVKATTAVSATAPAFQVMTSSRTAEFFQTHVQQTDGCLVDADPEDLTGGERAIIVTRQYLRRELASLEAERRRSLARFLVNRCQTVMITTDELDSAFRIFTVVNRLGKPLSRSEILKAELIADVPLGRRAAWIASWEACEDKVGDDFESFFSYMRAAYGRGKGPVIAGIRQLVRKNGGSDAFLHDVFLPAADVYTAMIGVSNASQWIPDRCRDTLAHLNLLKHADWVPPTLLWLLSYREQPDQLAAYLSALDRFAFGQLLHGVGQDHRITRYNQIVAAIREQRLALDDRGEMGFSGEEQKTILFHACNDFYGRNSQACKLLLIRLNDAIAGKRSGINPSAVTVEHILPQRIGANSPWRDVFTPPLREHYTGSLGNMVLIGSKANKDARNYGFDRKLETYKKDSDLAQLAINKDVMALSQWGPQQVQEREEKLIGALKSLWRLSGTNIRRKIGQRVPLPPSDT